MRKYFHSLQGKITGCILIFAVIPVMAVNITLQLQLEKQLLKSADFAFQNAVVNVDNTLKTLMREMGVTLNILSTDSTLYRALEKDKETFNDEIKTTISIDNLTSQYQRYVFYCYVDFLILDRDGTAYSTYYINESSALDSPQTMAYLEEIQEKDLNYTYFSASMQDLGSDSDTEVLCIGKNIRNYKRQYLGKAILIIDEEKLFRILQSSTLYDGSIHLLCDSDGIILSAGDKSLIGKSCEAYLKEHTDNYVLSCPLYNGWEFISMIPEDVLYREVSYGNLFIGIDILVTVCLILGVLIILHSFLRPVRTLKDLMIRVEKGDFSCRFQSRSSDELADLGNSFNHMTKKLSALFERTQTQQRKLLEQENEKERFRYMILQSQINPHLMFNTLNNIKWMALLNKDTEVANTISSFGRLLEKTLKTGDDHFTVREELEYLREYLQVMQLHIPQKIVMDVYARESVYDCKILKMLFQPIIENSIFHGFNENCTNPHIWITIQRKGDILVCSLKDNGAGIPENSLSSIYRHRTESHSPSHSIGLNNVKERLKLFYGNSADMKILSLAGKGTTVIFHLPILEK